MMLVVCLISCHGPVVVQWSEHNVKGYCLNSGGDLLGS